DTCTTWMALAYHSMTARVLTRRIATGENARFTSIPEPADIRAYRPPLGACTGYTPPTGPYTVLASPRKPGAGSPDRSGRIGRYHPHTPAQTKYEWNGEDKSGSEV